MTSPKLRFMGFNSSWNVYSLNDFFEFIDGDRGGNYPNENDFSNKGYCVFLNAHNISENGLTFTHINWLTKEKHQILRKGTVQRGDLILTSRGSKLGKLALYNESVPYDVVRINSAMLIIRKTRDEMLQNYSTYLFKESILPNFIKSNKVGSAQPHITVKDLKKIKFSMPPEIKEQQKIANFFSLLDNRIERQQLKVEALKEQKKGLLEKIFSQELRFKDDDGKCFTKWETKLLKELGSFKKSYPYSRAIEGMGEIRYIHYGDIHSKYGGIVEINNFPSITITGSYDFIENGDIIFADASEDYNDLGKCITVRIKDQEKVISGLHTHRFKVRESVDPRFLLYYSKTKEYKTWMRKLGAGISVLGISKSNLEKIELSLPTLQEQRKISNFLFTFDSKITNEEVKLKFLQEQKKGFMQQMFI